MSAKSFRASASFKALIPPTLPSKYTLALVDTATLSMREVTLIFGKGWNGVGEQSPGVPTWRAPIRMINRHRFLFCNPHI